MPDDHSPTGRTLGRRGPLDGVKIVEFAGLGPAPFAAMMLADMGADVVEIVRPGTPGPHPADFYLRGRRRVELDLKTPSDRDTAAGLASSADVLIEGFRPGVMERLGLGPADLRDRAPRLVYARMTGWGQDGPLADTAGHDINYIAVAGALHCMRSDQGQPVPPLNLVGDIGGGALYLITGILAALLDRGVTGRGQVIDTAICDCVAHMLTPFYALRAKGQWAEAAGANVLDGGAYFYRSYRCSDGGYLSIGSIEEKFDEQMLRLLGVVGGTDAARSGPAAMASTTRRIAEAVATRTRDEWVRIFEGSDACVAPVLSLDEATADPHMRARGAFLGEVGAAAPAPAPRFSGYRQDPCVAPSTVLASPDAILTGWSAAGRAQQP